ncbi:Hypothetical predicted protein [Podarcis lilfordi]|uniref:Uncharacterized protein n=1 Tax=Podarcis lilfordi TaxID=74358 RepID=A0AA35PCD7_9SAUR|nr:Hypothetical predicted protein [Podarcis lilfordi]
MHLSSDEATGLFKHDHELQQSLQWEEWNTSDRYHTSQDLLSVDPSLNFVPSDLL